MHPLILIKLLLVAGLPCLSQSFVVPKFKTRQPFSKMHMSSEDAPLDFNQFRDLIYQGIAAEDERKGFYLQDGAVYCPGFGETGWGPLCWLHILDNNPVYNTFDKFQLFIQNSIVSLHDFLHNTLGIEYAYGLSIVVFTFFVRILLSPIAFKQLQTSELTKALQPKVAEIREKYTDKNMQNQMVAMLYQETQVNPLAGCLPALFQLPIFLSLYRSFTNLASGADSKLNEPFLWVPSLTGPVFGQRSMNWITDGWPDNYPVLGWHDTIAYLSVPILLVIIQYINLSVVSPPSSDPTVAQTQRVLRYLPWLLGYFGLSVPSGLGIYWVTNNSLSTLSSLAIKQYFKMNPPSFKNVDLEKLASSSSASTYNSVWGYRSEAQMMEEAKLSYRPVQAPLIPEDFAV